MIETGPRIVVAARSRVGVIASPVCDRGSADLLVMKTGQQPKFGA